MIQVRFTTNSLRDLKKLKKKYKKIEKDIGLVVDQLSNNNITGDRIQNAQLLNVYKIRAKNSSAGKGKSGGFRIIYYLKLANEIYILSIYSKSQKTDCSMAELIDVLKDQDLL